MADEFAFASSPPSPIPDPTLHPPPAPSTPGDDSLSFATILEELPAKIVSEFENISDFLRQLLIEHILPSICFAAAFVGIYNLGRVLSKQIWPPSGREIYSEALTLLKKDAYDTKSEDIDNNEDSNRAAALELLQTAITKDPELEDAYITLAMELIYGSSLHQDTRKAIEVLTIAKERFSTNREIETLLTEAKAIVKSGRGNNGGASEEASARIRRMAGVGMIGNTHLSGGVRVR